MAMASRERVWVDGSPLRKPYTALKCELCNESVTSAVVLSVGLTWRSGWVFLCDACYLDANFWDEDAAEMDRAMELYRVYDSAHVPCACHETATAVQKSPSCLNDS
jgi:hypothetical protein